MSTALNFLLKHNLKQHYPQITRCNINNKVSLEKIVATQTLIDVLFIIFQNKLAQNTVLPLWFSDLLNKLNTPEYICASIPEIAQLANYSPKSLVSYFRKYTGDTIVVYQNKLKVNYACKLLSNTTKTTLDIANELMYSSLTAFNCMFKKYTGMTPKEYRNESKHRNDSETIPPLSKFK